MPQTTQDKRGIWLSNSSNPIWSSRWPNGDRPENSFQHGSSFTLSNSALGSASPLQKEFSGLILDPMTIGATVSNQGNWLFTTASANPTVFNDPTVGKCFYNNYPPGNDLDACKTIMATAPIQFGEKLYSYRKVRCEILTTGSAIYPSTGKLQWKTNRYKSIDSISDGDGTPNNSIQLVGYNWRGNPGDPDSSKRPENQVQFETGDGEVPTGSVVSIAGRVVTISGVTLPVNGLKFRRFELTSGANTGGGSSVESNTANTITLSGDTAMSPGNTFKITNGFVYGDSSLILDINAPWAAIEEFVQVNTEGNSDGLFIRYLHIGGARVEAFRIENFMMNYSSAQKLRYLHAQDYFGAAPGAPPIEGKKMFCKDFYFQRGTWDRVMLSDTNSMSSIMIPQYPTSWADGEVDIICNTAGLSIGDEKFALGIKGMNTIAESLQVEVT